MPSTSDIRAAFLSFFERHDHRVVDSSPLVPRNDPTLMFTNAGMVQFKNVFTGQDHRDYARAATSQKCVRAGGKHNDLENVGYTARHHTFFEMLGNFSFGDYFKDQAIHHAWSLITADFQIPKDKLLVTVYAEDEEAAALWRKIAGLPDDRIIRIATSDNFWSMGDTGPCGPCSEIFFDHGDHIAGGPPGSADEEGDRFIEIWNLVFMQFDQAKGGARTPLPRPSIDTGMGLERIAAVLQGQHDNYDIDLMRGLIEASADAANDDPDGPNAVSHRVIADHLRASGFLIADGVLPSNEGRGYVLRRIMRRAMRHIAMIGVTDPMMHRLAPALIRAMGDHFAELRRAEALIGETLKLEETRFRATLDRGLRLLEDETDRLGDGAPLPGAIAFTLYDTYGFPLDLTQDILRGQGRVVEQGGFDAAMAEQKARARAAWAGSGEAADESVWFDIRDQTGATEFLGYDAEAADGVILALTRDGAVVETLQPGESGAVVANQTPFYAESGGQQGDAGTIHLEQGAVFRVETTQKKAGGLHVHIGRAEGGAVARGGAAHFAVDPARRRGLRAHHSATHLLHQALRDALGDHVAQKGSLVAPDRLRFDISHPKPIATEEATAVEAAVNAHIRDNSAVMTRLMTPEKAVAAGAMALFGEKYGDEVRVVSMGQRGDDHVWSMELCGGTHVARTGDIGAFAVIGESAVAAGVRRVEAVTGQAALDWLGAQGRAARAAAAALKTTVEDLPARVASLSEERRKLERDLAEARKKLALAGDGGGAAAPAMVSIAFDGRVLEGVPGKELKGLADQIMKAGAAVVALVSKGDGKASVVVAVGDAAAGRVDAVDLVRVGAAAIGGKGGGGRPDMAQAGGPDADKAEAAIAAIAARLEESASEA